MNVYLAAPPFTAAERAFNEALAAELERRGHRVFLPQRDVPDLGGPGRTRRIFESCRAGLLAADVVVAVCDGPTVDDGTAWEIGHACAREIPVHALRTDVRCTAHDEAMNPMIQESASRIARSVPALLAALPASADRGGPSIAGAGAPAREAGGAPAGGGAVDSGPRLLAELKARCPDLAAVRARLTGRAAHEATLRQIDTYFQVPHGRLKLREVEGRPGQLIQYERPDVAAIKPSGVRLARVGAAPDVRSALATALGVRAVVAKTREIWRLAGVQVHLDTVDGLGTFVELEQVVPSPADLPAARAHLGRLLDALGIDHRACQAPSYSDLVLASPAGGHG